MVSNLTDLASARISLSKANFDQGLLWELSCKDEGAMKDLLLDNDLSFFPSANCFIKAPKQPVQISYSACSVTTHQAASLGLTEDGVVPLSQVLQFVTLRTFFCRSPSVRICQIQ